MGSASGGPNAGPARAVTRSRAPGAEAFAHTPTPCVIGADPRRSYLAAHLEREGRTAMEAFNEMNAQIAQFPLWLQWWLTWMQTLLILLPFVFIKRREAQVLIVAQVLNFAVGIYIYTVQGNMITKLFGLGHIFWGVAFGYFLYRIYTGKAETDGRPYFRAWLYVATVTLAISLVFDVYDTIQYIGGTREPMVEYYAQ